MEFRNMANIKYRNYSLNDFLHDDLFLQWQLFHSEELEIYWTEVLNSFPSQKLLIDEAIHILQSMQMKSNITEIEKDLMLEMIMKRHWKNQIYNRRIKDLLSWSVVAAVICMIIFLPWRKRFQDVGHQDSILAEIPEISLDSIKDIQLMIGESRLVQMKEDADISWNQEDKIELKAIGSESLVESVSDVRNEVKTLVVPYGKRSAMALPDGTNVWINSGTTLRFCIDEKKSSRNLYVDGEIYIEVAKDEEKPIHIYTSDTDVKVYGTKFNVLAYKQDITHSVVLLEGKVAVIPSRSKDEINLLPNQMFEEKNNDFQVFEVNAKQYITWKDGLLLFSGNTLSDVIVRLSRYYGVKFDCNAEILNKSCTGKLVLFDDIDKTLSVLADMFSVKYRKDDDKIVINK